MTENNAETKTNLPPWIKMIDIEEGIAEIILGKKSTINGVITNTLTIHSPTVKQTRTAIAMGKDISEQNDILFASMCLCSVDDLVKLKQADYGRIAAVYDRFLSIPY